MTVYEGRPFELHSYEYFVREEADGYSDHTEAVPFQDSLKTRAKK